MRMNTMIRAGSVALAVGRLLVGVTALAAPELLAGTWVGRTENDRTTTSVLGRALGARDLALGAGALLAARSGQRTAARLDGSAVDGPAHNAAELDGSAVWTELRRWVALGAVADGVDAVVTLRNWSALPPGYRLLVLGMAGGGAVAGGVAAVALSRE
jgi:hypothetical protein